MSQDQLPSDLHCPPETEFIVVQPYLDDGAKVGVGTLLTAAEIGMDRIRVMELKGLVARESDVLAPDDDEPASKSTKVEPADAGEVVALGLSKTIFAKLVAAGLTTRDAIVDYADKNDGLEKAGLGPVQAEKVFAALGGDVKKDEPPADETNDETSEGEGANDAAE